MSGAERNSLLSNRRKTTLLVEEGANHQVPVQLEAENLHLTKQSPPRHLEQTKGDTDQNPGPDLVVETRPRQENRRNIRRINQGQDQARGHEHVQGHAQDLNLEEEIEVDLGHYLATSPENRPRLPLQEQDLVTRSCFVIL